MGAGKYHATSSEPIQDVGFGGASRDRTDDQRHAMEALSQLSDVTHLSGGKPRTLAVLLKPDRTALRAKSAGASSRRLRPRQRRVQARQSALTAQQRERRINRGDDGGAGHGHAYCQWISLEATLQARRQTVKMSAAWIAVLVHSGRLASCAHNFGQAPARRRRPSAWPRLWDRSRRHQ